MAQTLKLEVVTPTGLVVRTDADDVAAPSVNGEFGVLPGHVPLLAALRAGVVRYRTAGKIHQLAVDAGFAEVGPDRFTVLTASAIPGVDVDVDTVRADRDDTTHQLEALKGAGTEARDELVRKREWLSAQLDAARKSGRNV